MTHSFESRHEGLARGTDLLEDEIDSLPEEDLAEGRLAHPGYDSPKEPVHPDRAWKILVVDDNRDIVRVIERLLTKPSYDTFSATDGDQAIELARSEHPDLILLDLNMPRMDGFEFLEAVNAELGDSFKSIVVVMLTTSLNPAWPSSSANNFCLCSTP